MDLPVVKAHNSLSLWIYQPGYYSYKTLRGTICHVCVVTVRGNIYTLLVYCSAFKYLSVQIGSCFTVRSSEIKQQRDLVFDCFLKKNSRECQAGEHKQSFVPTFRKDS